jgi:hypothetical protein
MVKLAKGFCNVELADLFGFGSNIDVSMIYRFMIDLLDNKARGLLHDGAVCLQHWANLFPNFVVIIRLKLNMPQYGGLALGSCCLIGFVDCKFNETCTSGSGLRTDEECRSLAQGRAYSTDSVLWLCESTWHQGTYHPLPKWDNWVPLWSHFRPQE